MNKSNSHRVREGDESPISKRTELAMEKGNLKEEEEEVKVLD